MVELSATVKVSSFTSANLNCDKCELKNSRRKVVNGELRPGSKVFLVGQSPGYLEDLKGKPFVGESGKELDMVLKKIGLKRDELSVSNACRCKPPTNRPKDKTLKKEEIRACRQYLINEIKYIKPNVVVCMGNEALGAILGMKGVMDLRGIFYWSEELGCKVMVTIHPAAALRQWEVLPLLEWDLKKAKDGCMTKELPKPQKTNYKVVRNLRHFDALILSLLNAPVYSVDLETTGFPFLTDRILCIGFSMKQRTGIVLPLLGQHESRLWSKQELNYIRDELKAVLTEGALKIFQNMGFDWKFLKTFGITVRGPFFDTMIAHHMLNENLPQSLEFFSRTYTDLGCYERVIKRYVPSKTKGTFADVPNAELWRYQAQDADCQFRMFLKLAPQLKKEGLEKLFYKTTMPFARVLAEAEYRGVLVDRKKLETASKVLESSIKKVRGRLFEEAGHEFNPNSSKQVGEVLFKEKGLRSIKLTPTGAKSTDNEVLTKLARYHKIAKTLVELRSHQKLKSTYIDGSDGNGGIKRRLDANDRTHPDYSISGTVTGRLSCRSPDLQNIPRQPPEIRQMFIALKGWKILESDYSKAELWALACYSGCEKLKKDLPLDFHKRTAVTMGIKSRIEDVDKEDENRSKMLVFGLCVGGDTFIPTTKGWKMIEQLKKGDQVFQVDDKAQQIGVMTRRKTKLQKIFLSDGTMVKCTPDHPFYIVRDGGLELRPLSSLEPGDFVLVKQGIQVFGTGVVWSANNFKGRTNYRPLWFGKVKVDKELAYLLGFILAEGTLYKTQITFSNTDPGVKAYLDEICFELFGKRLKVYDVGTWGKQWNINSIQFNAFVGWMGLKKAGKQKGQKTFPWRVFQLKRQEFLSFLAGYLDGDGSFKSKGGMSFSTVSESILSGVVLMLKNLGVGTRLEFQTPQGYQRQLDVIIKGNLNFLKPFLKRSCWKKKHLVTTDLRFLEGFNESLILSNPKGVGKVDDWTLAHNLAVSKRTTYRSIAKYKFSEKNSALKFCYENNLVSVKIKSIEDCSDALVINFLADGDKSMLANAIYTLDCYGGREGGLSQSTGLPKGEVRKFINKWFELYPETEVWMDARRKDVKGKGCVISFLGRRRRFYGLDFVKDKVVRKSEREAINSPIQGLVSDLCCGAAVRIDKKIKENEFRAGLIMTTHDELFYEVPDEELAKLKEIVEQEMTVYIPEIGMGMSVDIEVGNCWSEHKELSSLDLVQLAA